MPDSRLLSTLSEFEFGGRDLFTIYDVGPGGKAKVFVDMEKEKDTLNKADSLATLSSHGTWLFCWPCHAGQDFRNVKGVTPLKLKHFLG